jgi:hypothetical protein
MTRLFTEDGGEIVGFGVAFYGNGVAFVRYGSRLRMEMLDDLTVVDPDDAERKAIEDEKFAQSKRHLQAARLSRSFTNAISGPQTGRGVKP